MRSSLIQFTFFILFLLIVSCSKTKVPEEVSRLNHQLAKGWNTWNTRSVLSYVSLPEAYSIDIQLKDTSGKILTEALIGRRGEDVEKVTPGPHAFDGSYTELKASWHGIDIKVQTAHDDTQFVMIVTPLKTVSHADLLIKPGIKWGEAGNIDIGSDLISFKNGTSKIQLHVLSEKAMNKDSLLVIPADKKIYIYKSGNLNSQECENFVSAAENKHALLKKKYGEDSTLFDAMQTVLAWDIIYEPVHKRVIAPVSRIWNCNWNGWVLFDWDTYFASIMFSIENKELAYSNAIAITHEITSGGFIPNFGSGICKSEDRSQPPVGSFAAWQIYQRYHEKWFLRELFNDLVTWNRWWEKNRDVNGFLVWGSDPYDAGKIPSWLSGEIGKKQAAMWESGLDNSPMYDQSVFDSINHKLMIADVGLMSMYIWDCKNLSLIASELGETAIKEELGIRAAKYSKTLETLWDEKTGMYLNKDLVTGILRPELSPTNFYVLLTSVPSQERAERIINQHFYNPEEFWGDWIIPSISRNNNAFKDNTYWRGRIWAPMNMLVYQGLLNYKLSKPRKDLAEKSAKLLLKSWLEERHIYENYNAVTGEGDDVENSDKFYHWGALLAYIAIMEDN